MTAELLFSNYSINLVRNSWNVVNSRKLFLTGTRRRVVTATTLAFSGQVRAGSGHRARRAQSTCSFDNTMAV